MTLFPVLNNTPVGKQVDSIYESRLDQFLSEGQYRDFNLPSVYDHARIDNPSGDVNNDLSKGFVDLKVYRVPDLSRPSFNEVVGHKKFDETASKGDTFGPSWATFWFEVHIRLPKSWAKYEQVIFQWNCDNEGLVYSQDGVPLQAFSGSERTDFILPDSWKTTEDTFYIEMACNGMFGTGAGSQIAPPDPNRYFTLTKADLVAPNLPAMALAYDFLLMQQCVKQLPSNCWQKYKARQICNDIMNTFHPNDLSTINECRNLAKAFLGNDIDSEAVFEKNNDKANVFAIGHCHIDTAWLWPFAETRRKIVRSWATQMNIMDRYPEYQFVCSQALQYLWLKEDHPDVFEKLKEYVNQNKFIPIGGSWVEHDTNIPNGESLIRQFLLGQHFFEKEFGVRCRTFWLPDTFGYSSQIPQICRLCGMDRFLTQKLSWNNINSFPTSTFNWVALDGSQVICHMPPANTYTADTNVNDVLHSIDQHKNLVNDQAGLLVFGIGDGGGGPTPEMLEKLRRCKGIANTVGYLPNVKLGNTVDEFFDGILKRTNAGQTLPSWNGELYFEFHRGTYTTQAELKKLMRKVEIALHDAEYVSTLASIFSKDYSYPKESLQDLWRDTLLCQFHDVLPGSCIEMVYKDAIPIMSKVLKNTEALLWQAIEQLGFKKASSSDNKEQLCLLNTLPWNVRGVITETEENKLVYFESCDGKGILTAAHTSLKHPAAAYQKDDNFILVNDHLRVTIAPNGLILSLFDLHKEREILDLKSGKNHAGANQYVLFEDTPLSWQAWDTEVFSLEKYEVLDKGKVSIKESGPLRASVVVDIPISELSHMKATISLEGYNDCSEFTGVNFTCEVDWHESCKFLKVEFPVDIHSEFASYETQFGITKRPTHYNTSWDVAKFEVCHQKFADYSDFTYGVSVLNDCKYGFSTHGNLMRLSLLRSPKQPDAHADMGKHTIRYAVYPHSKPLDSSTVRAAHKFNSNFRLLTRASDTANLDIFDAFQLVGEPNVILSHIKMAEKGKSIILRVYESLGGKSRARLVIKSLTVASVTKCNGLEEDLEELCTLKSNDYYEVPIELRAFEIATFKVNLGSMSKGKVVDIMDYKDDDDKPMDYKDDDDKHHHHHHDELYKRSGAPLLNKRISYDL
uniref:Ams1 n=1 Tax=Schizosaccharomyces pombe (strain 972 / ATCC 24843) TaxID=284812 RepID=UPI001658713D|nr:Chain A, Ams1 [Schizosaccharomyces pombe 972h-]6LZ1_B Chain B, Ams1 [Schizosaccharomyces pombe 972h-]6LZ1_C Chain C, Ams1 [Schizosaccharomyces pombe 972h-]6LZ1_D Chain D, Ams1 [Schizosaccharomyces pombe 972h-]